MIDAVRVVLANEAEVNQISFWSHSQDLFSLISQPPSAGNSCQCCSAHCMPTLPRRFAVSSICLVCAQRRNSNYCPPSILQMRLITHLRGFKAHFTIQTTRKSSCKNLQGYGGAYAGNPWNEVAIFFCVPCLLSLDALNFISGSADCSQEAGSCLVIH